RAPDDFACGAVEHRDCAAPKRMRERREDAAPVGSGTELDAAERAARPDLRLPNSLPGLAIERMEEAALLAGSDQHAPFRAAERERSRAEIIVGTAIATANHEDVGRARLVGPDRSAVLETQRDDRIDVPAVRPRVLVARREVESPGRRVDP